MQFYLTDTDGTGGSIKNSAEDFIVKEISNRPAQKDEGRFVIADVTSKNWETNRLVRLLARTMFISREKIGFAGTKDKRAITTQLMSFECPKEKIDLIQLDDVSIQNVYTANRGVRIGDLIGNSFDIRVRNCTMPLSEIPSKVKKDLEIIKTVGGFPNYFGVQRFGTVRPITHIVGERIVRGDLKGAVMTYLSQQSEFEGEEINDIRRRFGSGESFEDIIPDMPKTMGFEKTMAEHLVRQPEDYIGAIAEMPGNLQMMFTHAYQSYMFNMMLSERMRRNIPLNEPILGDVVVPIDADGNAMHDDAIITTSKNIDLVKRQVTRGRAFVTITLYGTDSTFAEGEMGEIERNFIENEGITERDFVVPGLPHCTSKGTRREIICPVRDLDFKMEDDGYSVRFSLPKGNYATCMMREILKSDMTDY